MDRTPADQPAHGTVADCRVRRGSDHALTALMHAQRHQWIEGVWKAARPDDVERHLGPDSEIAPTFRLSPWAASLPAKGLTLVRRPTPRLAILPRKSALAPTLTEPCAGLGSRLAAP